MHRLCFTCPIHSWPFLDTTHTHNQFIDATFSSNTRKWGAVWALRVVLSRHRAYTCRRIWLESRAMSRTFLARNAPQCLLVHPPSHLLCVHLSPHPLHVHLLSHPAIPSSLHPPATPEHNIIVISSDDEAGPLTPIPAFQPCKRSIPDSPELILILESDEEQDLVTKWPKLEQEHEVAIKIEPGVKCCTPTLPQHSCQPSGNSIKSSGSEMDHSFSQQSSLTVFCSDDEPPKWPQDYYVCDILTVFKKPPHGVSKRAVFERQSPGLPFKKSMFYDNYNLWKQTPIAFCTQFENYSWTKKGSWKGFLAACARHLHWQA